MAETTTTRFTWTEETKIAFAEEFKRQHAANPTASFRRLSDAAIDKCFPVGTTRPFVRFPANVRWLNALTGMELYKPRKLGEVLGAPRANHDDGKLSIEVEFASVGPQRVVISADDFTVLIQKAATIQFGGKLRVDLGPLGRVVSPFTDKTDLLDQLARLGEKVAGLKATLLESPAAPSPFPKRFGVRGAVAVLELPTHHIDALSASATRLGIDTQFMTAKGESGGYEVSRLASAVAAVIWGASDVSSDFEAWAELCRERRLPFARCHSVDEALRLLYQVAKAMP